MLLPMKIHRRKCNGVFLGTLLRRGMSAIDGAASQISFALFWRSTSGYLYKFGLATRADRWHSMAIE
ncbi:hypothetical protein SAMN05444167_0963 [Terriglobus roseus]|uniref:Uncharacterized protein n=1 Tax=Terriglobus roseus TaxID=392734 RepID=A0A1G7H8I9_9BACT|nr:hypothetical protein SAMN05444167_0963 [Terriglobus roseus]